MNNRVAFLHPDLGIGGAERAIVDAAMALKLKNFDVTIFTNHHDINHCFEETKNGDLKVVVIGDFILRSLFGRFCAFFAYLRMIFAALYLILFKLHDFDLIYVDQVSAPVPLLKLFGFKILFYAHFPDFLLSKPGGAWKQFYRLPIDFVEKFSLLFADIIIYNSKFTSLTYRQHFRFLKNSEPLILYPVPNINNLVSTNVNLPIKIGKKMYLFLSINRYEEKKNIALALKAFAFLKRELRNETDDLIFVHFGGYDDLVEENAVVYNDLVDLSNSLGINDCVHLLKSCSNAVKVELLKRATALLYTPSNEHFGIVPIEAMYLHCPVIAVNNGGPLESVVDGITGFLCEPQPDLFARSMEKLMTDEKLRIQMGDAGHRRVVKKFSFTAFQDKLSEIVSKLIQRNN